MVNNLYNYAVFCCTVQDTTITDISSLINSLSEIKSS